MYRTELVLETAIIDTLATMATFCPLVSTVFDQSNVTATKDSLSSEILTIPVSKEQLCFVYVIRLLSSALGGLPCPLIIKSIFGFLVWAQFIK